MLLILALSAQGVNKWSGKWEQAAFTIHFHIFIYTATFIHDSRQKTTKANLQKI